MTNELETQDRSDAQELNLNDLDAAIGGVAATPDNSGAGKPVWAGVIAPGQAKS
jgi:hypothetical protein